MRSIFLAFTSMLFIIMVYFHYPDWRAILNWIGIYSLCLYWAFGYGWSSSSFSKSNRIIVARNYLLLVAIVSFNVLVIYNTLYDRVSVVYLVLWLVVTTLWLAIKWEKINK